MPPLSPESRRWLRSRPMRARCGRAFSLLELLIVVGFMSVLVAVTVPAINSLKGGSDFSRAVDTVALTLDRARTYAITRNTYVWVGFYEESPSATSATVSMPPFPGRGQVVMAVAASVDGTKIFDEGSPGAALPADRIFALERIQKIPRVHLADVGAPGGGDSAHLDGRPDLPYAGDGAEESRISSESGLRTPYPFSQGGYTFHKTIRFSPGGEATINGAPIPKRWGEIGLVPAQGDQAVDSPNLAAVQFSGMGGNVRVYRR